MPLRRVLLGGGGAGSAVISWPMDLTYDDAFVRAALGTLRYGRSGTPDADPGGDAWVDKANQATNHGNEALLIAGEVVNTERRGLMEFDFTRFTGLTATGGVHSFTLRAAHDVPLGSNDLRVRMSTLASRPFTESTVTWDTPVADGGGPAEGTLRVNTTIAVANGAAALYTINLTDANINGFLGSWVYVRLLSEAALAATTFTVNSRDDATVGNQPTFSFVLRS